MSSKLAKSIRLSAPHHRLSKLGHAGVLLLTASALSACERPPQGPPEQPQVAEIAKPAEPAQAPAPKEDDASAYIVWQLPHNGSALNASSAWIHELDGEAQARKVREGLYTAVGDQLWKLTVRDPNIPCQNDAGQEDGDQDTPDCPPDIIKPDILEITNLTDGRKLAPPPLEDIANNDAQPPEITTWHRVLGALDAYLFTEYCVSTSPPIKEGRERVCDFYIYDLDQGKRLTVAEFMGDWRTSKGLAMAQQNAHASLKSNAAATCTPDIADLDLVALWPTWAEEDGFAFKYKFSAESSNDCANQEWSDQHIATTVLSTSLPQRVAATKHHMPSLVEAYWDIDGHTAFQGWSEVSAEANQLQQRFDTK